MLPDSELDLDQPYSAPAPVRRPNLSAIPSPGTVTGHVVNAAIAKVDDMELEWFIKTVVEECRDPFWKNHKDWQTADIVARVRSDEGPVVLRSLVAARINRKG